MMRVAVRHTDENHDNAGWFAFEQGLINGLRDPISGTAYSAEEVAEALLRRAKEQFPESGGYEHRLETLHVVGTDENGKEQGEWHPVGESELPSVQDSDVVAEHQLKAAQGQEESAE